MLFRQTLYHFFPGLYSPQFISVILTKIFVSVYTHFSIWHCFLFTFWHFIYSQFVL